MRESSHKINPLTARNENDDDKDGGVTDRGISPGVLPDILLDDQIKQKPSKKQLT